MSSEAGSRAMGCFRPVKTTMRPSALLVVAIMSLSAEPSHAQPARDARPLHAAEIRARLDDDTILLEYALGEQRSFLWA